MLRSGPHRLGDSLVLSSLSLVTAGAASSSAPLISAQLAIPRHRDETRCMQREYGKIRSTFVPQKKARARTQILSHLFCLSYTMTTHLTYTNSPMPASLHSPQARTDMYCSVKPGYDVCDGVHETGGGAQV
ncbi:hypothetical protein V8C43DRAFT_26609 [Trichoderma afarasin]